MAENTKIEWAHHTFNPWVGCTKVSPACDHCYAEAWAKRTGSPELWQGSRRRTSAANWQKPRKWEREAAARGIRYRVFCASLADVFDNQVPAQWRSDLFALIEDTPNLTWMLLTKRPQNIADMLWPKWDSGLPENVWIGTTAEDEAHYRQRWAHVAAVPARIRFLSYEPALGPIGDLDLGRVGAPNWVIAGGESGPGARPMHPDWARGLRDQCAAAGVPFFFKQWGEWVGAAAWNNCDDQTVVELPSDVPGGVPGTASTEAWEDMSDAECERMVRLFDRHVHCWGDPFDGDQQFDEETGDPVTVPASVLVGKKRAGARLDGVEHREFPGNGE